MGTITRTDLFGDTLFSAGLTTGETRQSTRRKYRTVATSLVIATGCFVLPALAGDCDAEFGPGSTVGDDFDGAKSIFAADVDGDGDIDILGAAGGDDEITWWENTAGNGTVWVEHLVDSAFDGAYAVHAADVDGDGDMDVLGAAFDADEIAWWENTTGDGTVWIKHTVTDNFDGTKSVYAADVDGDGDVDVLGAAVLLDTFMWWENTTGDGTVWIEHTIDDNAKFAKTVYAADVDGDGDVDVLGAVYLDDNIKWWENTAGNGKDWNEHTVAIGFDLAWSVYASDVDGDGDIDVLGASAGDDEIAWWENTEGDGRAWIKYTIGNVGGARSIHAADLDDDGDTDVLSSAVDDDEITWWENTAGDGSFWIERILDHRFQGARSVYAADVDGDADVDIIGAAAGLDQIAWWEFAPVCPGDLNCNADVGTEDLIALLGSWGLCEGCPPDLDNDGIVGTSDLIELLGNWGPCR